MTLVRLSAETREMSAAALLKQFKVGTNTVVRLFEDHGLYKRKPTWKPGLTVKQRLLD
jgi:hypothetical protein